jgi:hypothetical protein
MGEGTLLCKYSPSTSARDMIGGALVSLLEFAGEAPFDNAVIVRSSPATRAATTAMVVLFSRLSIRCGAG